MKPNFVVVFTVIFIYTVRFTDSEACFLKATEATETEITDCKLRERRVYSNFQLPEGTVCDVICKNGEVKKSAIKCHHGKWNREQECASLELTRRKRGWWKRGWRRFTRWWQCLPGCPHRRHTNTPPKTKYCPGNIYVKTDERKYYATVSWNRPLFHDNEEGYIYGDSYRVTRSHSPGKFHVLSPGTTVVHVTASFKDRGGLSATCSFYVSVEFVTCVKPSSTTVSVTSCEFNDFMHGSNCSIKCHDGYEISINKTVENVTCTSAGKYDRSLPTCKVIECDPDDTLLSVRNGYPECTSTNYTYLTTCTAKCKTGYQILQGENLAICGKDKSWSRKLPDCEDVAPPVFNFCPNNQELVAEKMKTLVRVWWGMPVTTDNSGEKINHVQSEGPHNGSLLGEGINKIVYTAIDSSGNKNICQFYIKINVITCGWPTTNDSYLSFTCPDGLVHGMSCNADCGIFPVVGNNTVTCEHDGKWSYRDRQPFCKRNPCEPLPTPLNGAMVCDRWLYGQFCQLQCMEPYDIPRGAVGFGGREYTGRYVCSINTGEYVPSSVVPNCTLKRLPTDVKTLMSFFYYTGDCYDKNVQNRIKANFITNIRDMEENEGFFGICDTNISCNINNVTVRCGTVTSRRKRQTDARKEIRVQFILQTNLDSQNISEVTKTVKDIQNKYKEAIHKAANNGSFDLDDLKVQRDSFEINQVSGNCEEGYAWKLSSMSCVPCPVGTYMSTTDGLCYDCPVGSYKADENDVKCKLCPDGQSTANTGSLTESDCKDVCNPGTYSPTGLIPCLACPKSSFQPHEKSTTCVACPEGLITETTGNSNITSCTEMDIHLKANTMIDLGQIMEDINHLTLSFWMKYKESTSNFLLIQIGTFKVALNSYLNFQYKNYRSVILQDTLQLKNAWIQVVYVATERKAEVSIFKNRRLHTGKTFDLTTTFHIISKENISIYYFSNNDTEGLYLSSFQLSDRVIESEELLHIRKCNGFLSNTLISMKHMSSRLDTKETEIITPSVCYEEDFCDPNPCNGHPCRNDKKNFICSCVSGYRGDTCELPPDFCSSIPCLNAAQCTNTNTTYQCICDATFTGLQCEFGIVNGKWADWESWSSCSKSCENGTQRRERQCTNPPPNIFGMPCSGSDAPQTRSCNEQECPSCSMLTIGITAIMNCSENIDAEITCEIKCEEGFAFMTGISTVLYLQCGPQSNYKWNGSEIVPACGALSLPQEISVDTMVLYNNLPSCDKQTFTKELVYAKAKEAIGCVGNGTCTASVEVPGCLDKEDLSKIKLVLLTKRENEDEFMAAVTELDASLEVVNKTDDILTFEMEGIVYRSIGSEINGRITCGRGRGIVDSLCMECPEGTYSQSDQCYLCDKGFFQNEVRQENCKPCPNGYTSIGLGAKDIGDCWVRLTQEEVFNQTKESDLSDVDDSTLHYSLGGSVAVLIVIITLAVVAMQSRKRKKYSLEEKNRK